MLIKKLASEIVKGRKKIKIILAAETLICPGFENLCGLDSLCIAGTKYLLAELPFKPLSSEYLKTVEELIEKGYNVIIAHADRYDKYDVDKLINLGAKIQLNASAVCKRFLKPQFKKWFLSDSVVAVGSDLHMCKKSSYKNFIKLLKRHPDIICKVMQKAESIIT